MNPRSIKPLKKLGQVFLNDRNILAKIVESCQLAKDDTVFEIGAGPGQLTELLGKKVKQVYAVETDRRFCEELLRKFKGSNVVIIHDDILKFDIKKIPPGAVAVGNLPYYISSPIVTKLLTHHDRLRKILLTVQLEFGRRMTAKLDTKDYSALTCFVQYFSCPRMLFKIKKTSFWPVPKVDSCLIEIEFPGRASITASNEKFLFEVIHKAFQQRRKTIANALNRMADKNKLTEILAACRIDPKKRAENLTITDFVNIANLLDQN